MSADLLEGRQHNNYDIDYYGANSLVGSMYHAALRTGAKMATTMGDPDFAERCTILADQGAQPTMESIWREDWGYFVQDVDLAKHPEMQQGDGCLADQLFGQSLAHQCGLGHLYPADAVKKTMASIWTYNWAPSISPQNEAHPPERWYCRPGEGGLFMCTWPKSKHLGPKSVRYRNEVWTGTEYQVASHMLYEGMITEPLAIIRAIHERYDGVKHNPWNEIECGDHYARASRVGAASWGSVTLNTMDRRATSVSSPSSSRRTSSNPRSQMGPDLLRLHDPTRSQGCPCQGDVFDRRWEAHGTSNRCP